MANLYANPTVLAVKLFGEELANKMALIANIRPGDRVTINVPAGKTLRGEQLWAERTGKAVICSSDRVALNMGGRWGTPGVATAENLVKVTRPARKPGKARAAGFVFRGPA